MTTPRPQSPRLGFVQLQWATAPARRNVSLACSWELTALRPQFLDLGKIPWRCEDAKQAWHPGLCHWKFSSPRKERRGTVRDLWELTTLRPQSLGQGMAPWCCEDTKQAWYLGNYHRKGGDSPRVWTTPRPQSPRSWEELTPKCCKGTNHRKVRAHRIEYPGE